MVGTVRGVFTVVGAGAAGLLIWISTQIGQGTLGLLGGLRDPRRRGPDDGALAALRRLDEVGVAEISAGSS